MTVRKRKFQSALALTLVLGLGALTDPVGAQSTAEKLEAAEDRLAQVQREQFAATQRYDEANAALIRTQEEITATQRALDAAGKRIAGLQEQLNDRARAAYQLGSTSTLEMLLEARQLSEFSDRLVYLDRIAQDDADLATRVAVISEELRRLEANLGRLEEVQQVAFDEAQRQYEIVQDRLAEAQAIRDEWKDQLAAEQRAAELLAQASSGGAPGQIATVAGAGLQACPAPGTSFSDTFGAPRSGGRTHAGVDMMGSYGMPIYSALPGTVSHSSSSLGGNQAYVHSAGGTYTFYAHLQGFSDASGSVPAGTLIGYMGDTGNATGTPHLHFEHHPNGSLVNPTPYVAAVC